MELPHNWGYSGDRGFIEGLSVVVLDSEVEERIRGGENSFWDKRAVKQGLVIDPLGLPGNEPMWLFWRGWYYQRGGAGSLYFGRDRLPWSHRGRFRVRDLQTQKTRERKERATKFYVGEK